MIHTIQINDPLSADVDLVGALIKFYSGKRPIADMTLDDYERFTLRMTDLRHRMTPLRETDIASMIQNLAGDGLLRLRALAHTEGGYTLRLGMKRGGPRWTVKNWGDWYTAQEEAGLEAARRGWI